MESLFGLNIKVCALLTALDCILNIVKFVPESFIIRVNWFLFQRVAGSEANWDIILRENLRIIKVKFL